MTVYRMPEKIFAICFDIDNTLYRDEEYSKSQSELLLTRLGKEKGWNRERVDLEMTRVKEITKKEQSQGNWFKMLGIPIETSVQWRTELLQPEEFLSEDRRLAQAISSLDRYSLCALTNNPACIGMRTLKALGIASLFSFIVGLDDTGFSKPSPEPFIEVEKRLGIRGDHILIIGDRYDVDLAIPLDRGWGAILVDNMNDVYDLPGVFN